MKIIKEGDGLAGTFKNRRLISRILLHLCMLIVALIVFFPFVWLASSSFKPQTQIFILPPKLVPVELYFDNFTRLIQEYPFIRWYANSCLISITRLGLSLFFCSLGGFALAKYRFRLGRVFSLLVLGCLMIPFQVLIVPMFITVYYLGLVNTHIAIILPWVASPFGIFMMRQYYLGIPDEFMDAARIDGATGFWIYLHIILPLGKAALGTLGVILFIWTWVSFLWPLIVLFSPEKYVLTIGLANLIGSLQVEPLWGEIVAGITLAVLPVVIAFVFVQKYYITGLTLGGLK